MIYLLKQLINVGYDEYDEKIIRAESESEAREIANKSTGDEGQIWTDPARVGCWKISHDGPSEEILGSFRAG